MIRLLLLFTILITCAIACQENSQTNTHSKIKAQNAAKNNEQNLNSKAQTPNKIKPKEEKILPSCVFIVPEPIDPLPPYDPYDPGPYDLPGYIPEPIDVITPNDQTKTIRDSIVHFPATLASFGNDLNDIQKYIDANIAGTSAYQYLLEMGIEGRIYIRLLIDINGKIRALDFLKFTTNELEILKDPLQKTFLTMPNWSPAKDEQGKAVVSEFTMPIRLPLFKQ
ncbi:MAG: hypothetical protein ACKOWW_04935 [Flavobacteriales bacterium]